MPSCIKCDNQALPQSDFCEACEEKEFRKIGGWLYLPALGLIGSIGVNGFSFCYTLRLMLDNYALFTGNLQRVMIFELCCFVGLFALAVTTASLFFRKKRALPKWYIGLLFSGLAFLIIDLALGYNYLETPLNYDNLSPLVRNIIGICIWVPYFRVSERVKRTFVR